MRFRIPLLVVLAVVAGSGCGIFRGFKPEEVVRHPDAPMLMMEVKGYARVAIYDRQNNKMIDYGWVDLSKLEGWSVHKFDWEAHIRKNEGD